jgi:Methyltransferase domain
LTRFRALSARHTIASKSEAPGFIIPCRYADAARAAASTAGYDALAPLFLEAEPRFRDLLDAIERLAPSLLAIGEARPPAPRWRQDWFPRLDAAAAYAIIQARAPGLLVEVGSGHSTRWFARAAADAGHATRIVAIDPAPRATVAGLSVELVRSTVQGAGEAPFAALAAGDVLSIDGSHVLMPGTDVDILLNRVLPLLPAGVLVHIHDVFLPEGYPAEWAWRGYNEQLVVAVMLQGCGYRVLWSSHWVATRLQSCLHGSVLARLPLLPGAHESSLWLENQGPPARF